MRSTTPVQLGRPADVSRVTPEPGGARQHLASQRGCRLIISAIPATLPIVSRHPEKRSHRAAFVTIKRITHERQLTRARIDTPLVTPNTVGDSDLIAPIAID